MNWTSIIFVLASAMSMVYLQCQINDLKERMRLIEISNDSSHSKLLESVGQSLQRLRSKIDDLNQFKERIESEEKVKKKQGASDQSPPA